MDGNSLNSQQTQPAASKPKAGRRKQAERTADSRKRIIDATIRCLHRLGYNALTISIVAKDAGVSRGLLAYHFDNKADLMVAVREAIQAEEKALLEAIRGKVTPLEYLKQLPRYTASGMRRKQAIAVTEILLASRSDSELMKKLRAYERALDLEAIENVRASFEEVGIEPPANLPAVVRTTVAAIRGLAISELVLGDKSETDASVDHLIELMSPLIPLQDFDEGKK